MTGSVHSITVWPLDLKPAGSLEDFEERTEKVIHERLNTPDEWYCKPHKGTAVQDQGVNS